MSFKGREVKIVWVDTQGEGSLWVSVDEAREIKPVVITSWGLCLKDAKEYVTVASSVSELNPYEEQSCRHIQCIPRNCVKRIVELAEKHEGEGVR